MNPLHRFTLTAILLTFLCGSIKAATTQPAIPSTLRDYVQKFDPSYAWKIVSQADIANTHAYTIELTSQTWQGIPWKHWLSILVPKKINARHTAILTIAGGHNNSRPPRSDSSAARMLANLATQCQAPMVILTQVPNQPLFDHLREDALIAFSFDKYLQGGDDSWPLPLPMVKSAVRAMDAAQAVLKQEQHLEIDNFIVTGASKRGWTTWLTAAVDPRVSAIAPIVIDVLNFVPQLKQQLASYGQFSEKIHDYTDHGTLKQIADTPRGRALSLMVDPFTYRSRYTMPKLILLGTNDPYWTVDAANLYFKDLPGISLLHYEPNAGHSDGGPGMISTLIAFLRTAIDGKPFPNLNWNHTPDGALHVNWKNQTAVATLWQADSPTRDFRKAHWTATPLEGKENCTVHIAPPRTGWRAYFVQVTFAGLPPMLLSTQITVLPKTFPHPDAAAEFGK